TDYEYAPTHVEDLVNAFRYTDARTVEKSALGTGDSIRHTYAEPAYVMTMGAEFIADAPANINSRSGYRIDEIGITPRTSSIELTDEPKRSKKPAILSVVVPIYNNGPHLLHKCI